MVLVIEMCKGEELCDDALSVHPRSKSIGRGCPTAKGSVCYSCSLLSGNEAWLCACISRLLCDTTNSLKESSVSIDFFFSFSVHVCNPCKVVKSNELGFYDL